MNFNLLPITPQKKIFLIIFSLLIFITYYPIVFYRFPPIIKLLYSVKSRKQPLFTEKL
jgi:hypothetical protein